MREHREASAACAETPTVHNQMRLARAAAGLGRHDEAQALYGQAAQGIHAEDPALLLGRALALIELGPFEEALALLDLMGRDADKGRTPAAALALGRVYEGLGRMGEADAAYQWAAGRLPAWRDWAATPPFSPASAAATTPPRPSPKWTAASPKPIPCFEGKVAPGGIWRRGLWAPPLDTNFVKHDLRVDEKRHHQHG